MKRMSPSERKIHAWTTIDNLFRAWTCKHGAWNRDKFLYELERQLKAKRRARKADDV